MSFATRGGELVRVRRSAIPSRKTQQYLDSVESLKSDSVFQKVLPYSTQVKSALLQNISTDRITIRFGEENSSVDNYTDGDGFILGSGNDETLEGGGVMRLSRVSLDKMYWTASNDAGNSSAKLSVLRVLD